MRNEKSICLAFSPRQRKRTVRFLESQALKGWLFCGFSALGWKFRRFQPKKVRFAVVYFPDAKEADLEGQLKLDEFREYCAHDGWQFAGSSEKMQVFYNESIDPVPIDTDAMLEVDNIFKAQWVDWVKALYLAIFLFGLVCVSVWLRNDGSLIGILTHQEGLWTFSLGLCFLIWSVLNVGQLLIWHKKAKNYAAECGQFLDECRFVASLDVVACVSSVLICLVLIFAAGWKVFAWRIGSYALMFMALVLVYEHIAKRIPDKKKRTRRFLLVCFLIYCIGQDFSNLLAEKLNTGFDRGPLEGSAWTQYAETPPLTAADLDIPAEEYTITVRETGFLARYQVEGQGFQYMILDVKFGCLYRLCLDESLPDHYYQVDAAPWGAEKTYRYGIDQGVRSMRWLLCYDGRIVEIQLSEEPTPEQMALVGEVLGN